jgi:hypothetical protein
MNEAPKKEDLQAKRELAQGAEELMANKAFTQAILLARQHLVEQLIDGTEADLVGFQAQLRALRSIPTELTVLMTDYRMALSRQKTQG